MQARAITARLISHSSTGRKKPPYETYDGGELMRDQWRIRDRPSCSCELRGSTMQGERRLAHPRDAGSAASSFSRGALSLSLSLSLPFSCKMHPHDLAWHGGSDLAM